MVKTCAVLRWRQVTDNDGLNYGPTALAKSNLNENAGTLGRSVMLELDFFLIFQGDKESA
jgi:hypothetical protein